MQISLVILRLVTYYIGSLSNPHRLALLRKKISVSADSVGKFRLPRGGLMQSVDTVSRQNSIINATVVNDEGVMAKGGDNGSLWFWDWESGRDLQQAKTVVQPGLLDCEAGIYSVAFDSTGSRLITCEADKTIKMWKHL